MIVPGLTDIIRTAFENKKFMTNGQPLPDIDFEQPLTFEITAQDSLNLYPFVECDGEHVTDFGQRFERQMYLQMTPDCSYADAVMELFNQFPALKPLAGLFGSVRKVRICIKHFSTVATPQELRQRKVSAAVVDQCVAMLLGATAAV
jgi:hypothetical protein